jgi:GT2 family glycosyltransferase
MCPAATPGTGDSTALPSPAPHVAVLILAWNGRALTEACVASYLAQDYPDFEVEVVDNASTDGTPAALRARFGGRIRLLENDTNRLFAGGMNAGLRDALGRGIEYILLTNNDVEADPGLLRTLMQRILSDSRIAAVAPKIYFFESRDVLWFAGAELSLWTGWPRHRGLREPDRGQHDTPLDCDYLTGCAFLVRRAAVEAVGLFDEGYAMYAEDADWCFRARQSGWRLMYEPRARLWHHVSATAGARSWFKMRRRVTSQLRFLRRHAHWYHWLVIPFGTVAEACRIAKVLLQRRR